jgi:gas vesicle protein
MRGLMNGMIFGAIVAFLFDPISGNRRRALARDKFIRYRNEAMDISDKFVRDKRNRLEGLKHRMNIENLRSRVEPRIEDLRSRVEPRIEDLRSRVEPRIEEMRDRIQPMIERGREMLDRRRRGDMNSGRMNPI